MSRSEPLYLAVFLELMASSATRNEMTMAEPHSVTNRTIELWCILLPGQECTKAGVIQETATDM